MRINIAGPRVLALVFLGCSVLVQFAQAEGQSPANPAPVGMSLTTEIQCGPSASALEPYDVRLTLLQVIRGSEAWERLQKAGASNKPPQDGYEYILARVGFEIKARGAPANKTFDLGRPLQFVAIAPDGREYATPSLTLPDPALKKTMRSGDSLEGWLAFAVERGEKKPLMAFDPASGGAMMRGPVLWFRLY